MMDNKTISDIEMDNSTASVLDFQSILSERTFGKHEFISSSPWTAYPSILILCLASLVGTGGNVMTILALAMNKHIRNVESAFFVNLAISDLYVTAVADPMNIVGKLLLFEP